MRKNNKIIMGSIVALAVIVVLGIVYAAFTQQLTINGSATGRSSSWKIYFSRLTGPTLNGTAKQITAPEGVNVFDSVGDGSRGDVKYGSIGSAKTYAESYVKSIVDSWFNNKFTDELKTVDGYSARLITFDEVHSFGYGDEPSDCGGGYCPYYPKTDSVPGWIYNNNYWYWTMSPINEKSIVNVWYVHSTGNLNDGNVEQSPGAVRPVINVYKDKISQS